MFFRIVFFLVLSCSLFAQSGETNISVLTFNILHGKNTDGKNDLSKIINIITKANPDFIALQEVDKNTNRSNNRDIAKEISDEIKFNFVFGKAIDFDNGEYGIAVLARKKIIESNLIKLPNAQKREARVLLSIKTITTSGDTIIFCNTHLDNTADDSLRIVQATTIDSICALYTYPTILTGDLNDIPNSKTLKRLLKSFKSSGNKSNTFPSKYPIKKIDYVLFKPENSWRTIGSKVIQDSIASDHCAYWVKLKLQ